MSWRCEEIQDKRLSPASSKEAYNLHLAALEWSLVEPIIINKPEDIKATNWRDTGLTPYTHQVKNLITFCRKLPVGLIADDVGLGKTISAGLIVSELMSRRKVSRVLIICPKVLTSQWVSELEEKFKLFGREFTGKDLKGAFRGKTPIVVTTYHSASNRLADLQDGMFDMVILDEAHKLRNLFGNQSSPAIATNIRKTLERRPFKYVLMLTATPIQNRVWDLYSLIDILKVAEGKANPLGNPAEFSQNYLEPGTGGRKLMPHMAQEFQNRVKDCISRNRRSDVLLHFPRRIIELFKVPLTVEEKKMIKVVADQIENLNPMLQTSIAQAMMSSPRALVTQVKNMAKSGTIMPYVVQEIEDLASRVKTPAKLGFLEDWIAKIIRDNPTTWRVVVFTVRLETQAMLHEVFKAKGYKVGLIKGGEHHANQRTIDGYRKNPPEINLIISSDAGSEGINLQAGNTLVNYDLPWNPMIVEQRIGRVQRLGSDFSNVSIGNLVGQGTVEERIVGRLTEKLQGVAQAIGDIEGILEAANIDEEEGSKSYESRIRELVVGSLRGVDVSQVQDQMLQNIEIARQIYEAEKRNIDVVLGNAGTDHASVKAMPRIETKPPQMPSKEFVLRAMKNNGYRLDQKSESMYEATKPGAPVEKISFSENELDQGNSAFGGQNIKQYIPGRPHFERLVQHWVDHNGHHVTDSSQLVGTLVTDMARSWVSAFPGIKLVDTEFRQGDDLFFGAYHIRVKASNGVDSYEKIISGRINQELEIPLSSNDTGFEVLDSATRLAELAPMFQRVAQAQTNSDNDIGRFCKFYQTRLEEGLQEAGSDRTNERKLKNDFEPKVHAEVVGLEGFKYQKGTVRIRVDVDSFQYLISIPAIPACRRWLEQPPVGECALTGLRVPKSFLESCVSTGMQALRHKMEKYGDDGFVIPSELVECEYSGARMLKTDAVEESPGVFVHKKYFVMCEHLEKMVRKDLAIQSFSGRWGSKEIILVCPVSEKKCLPDETVRCKSTGRTVCIEAAVQSELTGDWYAEDQLICCERSGKMCAPPDMIECQITHSKVHYSESAVCSVCSKHVRADYLVTSAASRKQYCKNHGREIDGGRNALPEEIGTCAISGKALLLNELTTCQSSGEIISKDLAGTCSISGRTLRKSMLVNCASTGRILSRELARELAGGRYAIPVESGQCAFNSKFYLLSEMGTCDLTGNMVMKGHLARCCVTGATVRMDKLAALPPSMLSSQNDSTQRFYCPDLTVKDHAGAIIAKKDSRKCAVSGMIYHVSETTTCQHTGATIHESMSATCQVSGKVARKDILLKSAISGILMLPEFAVKMSEGGYGTLEETGTCIWTGQTVIRSRLKKCKLTGIPVCKELLNEDQELAILRDMLAGKNMGTPVEARKLSRLKGNAQISTWIKGKVTENSSPLENIYAIAALHTGLLGINVKVYVAVMRSDPDGEKLLGKFSTLERRGGLWWILDT